MIRNTVFYKGVGLVAGSTARQLFDDKKFKELDAHQARLAREEAQRQGRA